RAASGCARFDVGGQIAMRTLGNLLRVLGSFPNLPELGQLFRKMQVALFGLLGVAVWFGYANPVLADWNGFTLAGNGVASRSIVAVSRIPNSMEVWWIAPDGSVHDAYWYESQPWRQFELAPPGSASVEGGIAAVSRIPTSMEVWWIAPNGSVQD